ncbi:MAG: protease inhibitor I42 family protein [Aristaeellaceae bacterium]
MKKLLSILTAITLTLSCACPAYTEEAGTVTLSFAANSTTGYTWSAQILGGHSVALENPEGTYLPDPNPDGLVGAGGKTSFTLKAVQPGESILRFAYSRAWEDSPIEETILLVVVEDDLSIHTTDVTECGVMDGVVAVIHPEEHTILLTTDGLVEVLARLAEDAALPEPGAHIRIYTSGVMTTSLPGMVDALAWDSLPADASLPSLDDLTGISAFLNHVTDDNPIVSARYSEGNGLADASFSTGDRAELQLLLDAVLQLEIKSESEIFVTDWYPSLSFTCADGRSWGLGFNGHWLAAGGHNYNLAQDEALWAAIAQIKKAHAADVR